METLIRTLSALTASTPLFIVWLIGVALALSRWRRHPQVSLFALIACVVMIVNQVGVIFLYTWLSQLTLDQDWWADNMSSIFAAIRIVSALIDAAAGAMILCAIFGWRDGRGKQDFFPPAPPTFGNEPREQHTTT
jgi:hypothetical protein